MEQAAGLAKLAYTVTEAAEATGISVSKLYCDAAEGKLVFSKSGRRTLILASSLSQYLSKLKPKVGISQSHSRAMRARWAQRKAAAV